MINQKLTHLGFLTNALSKVSTYPDLYLGVYQGYTHTHIQHQIKPYKCIPNNKKTLEPVFGLGIFNSNDHP
jgi:hypothetical protein